MSMNFPLILLSLSLLASISHSSNTLTDSVAAEKTRLGSTPPSCHNKCNQCHPCMAVQVPTLPSHSRVGPPITPPPETGTPITSRSAGNADAAAIFTTLNYKFHPFSKIEKKKSIH
ncbi:hypothetical protein SASPL_155865 [Salvia splendens]|uniref:Epidermal patterning factor-like protein n=1 Tax=Salvia splendens TaxID=180675 RepID=A0A8X8YXR7_SALSN|nr:hypothetical protein SASPL_155865 [Salvia splendens]